MNPEQIQSLAVLALAMVPGLRALQQMSTWLFNLWIGGIVFAFQALLTANQHYAHATCALA